MSACTIALLFFSSEFATIVIYSPAVSCRDHRVHEIKAGSFHLFVRLVASKFQHTKKSSGKVTLTQLR